MSLLPNSSLYIFILEVYVPCYLLPGGCHLIQSALPIYQFNIIAVLFEVFGIQNSVLIVEIPIGIRML
jgi:hypothetical protein